MRNFLKFLGSRVAGLIVFPLVAIAKAFPYPRFYRDQAQLTPPRSPFPQGARNKPWFETAGAVGAVLRAFACID